MVNTGDCCKIPSYDSSILDDSLHGFIVYYTGRKKKGTTVGQIDLATAKGLVDARMARIQNNYSVRLMYTRKEFNQLILERDKYICHYCGKFGDTVDHVIPKSKGGLRTFSNCVCACRKCNYIKGNEIIDGSL